MRRKVITFNEASQNKDVPNENVLLCYASAGKEK